MHYLGMIDLKPTVSSAGTFSLLIISRECLKTNGLIMPFDPAKGNIFIIHSIT